MPLTSPATREERNRLVEQHLPLVPYLARRYAGMLPPGLEFADLVQEGYVGLIRAVELYDPQKRNPDTGQPYRFSAYATWWIQALMRRALVEKSRTIALPEAISADLLHLKQAQREWWVRWQRDPTPHELAGVMQRTPAHILLLLDVREVKSLDETPFSAFEEEDAATFADLLAAPDPQPEREQQAEVADLLTTLSPEERRVVVCRYQLGQESRYGIEEIPLTYVEVARQLQVTSERVKTLEERALRKMRYWAERPVFGKGA